MKRNSKESDWPPRKNEPKFRWLTPLVLLYVVGYFAFTLTIGGCASVGAKVQNGRCYVGRFINPNRLLYESNYELSEVSRSVFLLSAAMTVVLTGSIACPLLYGWVVVVAGVVKDSRKPIKHSEQGGIFAKLSSAKNFCLISCVIFLILGLPSIILLRFMIASALNFFHAL